MNFMTTAEAAKKWGITTGRITTLAQGGRIQGAKLVGHQWMIPESTEKPMDARTRAGKAEKAKEPDTFRFPGYEYRSLSSFTPPLNEEELAIKAATEAFYACRFKEAEKYLGNLADTTGNRYLRITVLHIGCMIDIFRCNTSHFLESYGKLTAELEEDFPHKAEMIEFVHSIEATLGDDDYYSHEFHLLPDYAYHESFLPRLANLSAVSLTNVGKKPTVTELRAHELNCIFLKDCEAFADLVPLHLYLGIAFGELGDTEKQKYHLRRALALAEKYEIYYCVVSYYYYMRKLFKPVLAEFSEEFRAQLEHLSISTHRMFTCFSDTLSKNSIYRLLHQGDFVFLHYAVQGLTNKEVAGRLHMSVSAVGNRYGTIYAALGMHNKRELVALYRKAVGEMSEG